MQEKRPNVILITVDSLRADHLGCYGYARPTSPNIDRFAKESCLFTNAFSNGPNTPHAFPAIMASRYPLMSNKLGLFDAPMTLAEVLQSEGYATAGFNAANPYISRYFNYDRGFDEFNDYLDFEIPTEITDCDSGSIVFSGSISKEIAKLPDSNIQVPKMDIERYVVTKGSIERKSWLEFNINRDIFKWIESIAETPFFIWVHYMDTHYPYVPQTRFQIGLIMQPLTPSEMFQINTRIRDNLPFSSGGLQRAVSLYDSAIRQLDTKLGEVLKFLKEHNLYDSSIIILTADHGEEFQDHGDLQHKSKMFDELLRVPLIVKLPYSNLPSVFTEIVGLIDLAPTVLAQLRIDNPFDQTGLLNRMVNINGRDGPAGKCILPSEASFDVAQDQNKLLLPYVIAETSYGINSAIPVDEQLLNIDTLPKLYCYRDQHWKMILDKGKNQTFLYNLLIDPNETRDKSDSFRNQANQLLTLLNEHSEFIEKKRLFSKIKKLQKKLNLAVS